MNVTSFALSAVGLAAAHVALARSAVLASTVIVHHFGSHSAGLDGPKASRFFAEVAGFTAFKPSIAAYTADHRRHHHPASFATVNGDPDAREIDRLGFRPGLSHRALQLRFWWTLISPRLHGPATWARLKSTFGSNQPRWRRGAAIVFWSGLLSTAAARGWLGPLLLGCIAPLLVLGNIASFVELASRHKWGWPAPDSGRERHAALSHGRHPLNWLPDAAAGSAWQWALMPMRLMLAMVARLVVLGGDLANHDHHHNGAHPQAKLHRRAWSNSAYEYTPLLASEPAAAANRFGGVWAALSGWMCGLSRQQRKA